MEGYPCYYVSDQGRVMSMRNPRNPKILRQGTNQGGYKSVTLTSGDSYGEGKKKSFRVNRLVAIAFIKNEHPDKRRDVGHHDSCPWNNFKENLYWCTPAENNANPITVQRRADARPEAVKKTSKPVYVYNEELDMLSAFTSTADAGRKLNTSQGNIASCCCGALPRYMGLIFSYIQLTDKSQREEVEKTKEYQKDKNRVSTMAAISKYYNKEKEKNSDKYQMWKARAREYSRDYYYKNHEMILQKMKERKRRERERKKQERRET